ncbi:Hint domain-containing protein [Paracoccus aminophilus]|uniref:Hedgehog/Intein (Hint) domain-containing protein n=1 Tax=Paracoccus aminophilus JCM 7686 TaxID=1367847 RepID=S5YAB1_PARAH|nr:Hint domain-containing protein [Paracoccus aminophilus]AGT08363.1 hypothetical protein JCM7686_1262 [Paracoccus aminophilus JCM 7686]
MPYYTEIPGATIDLTVATPVVSLGSNLLLNKLHGSTEFDKYDVDANQATTLHGGDNIGFVDQNNDPLMSGAKYAGSGSLSTASVNVGLPPLLGVTVQLNPINGHYVVGPDNKVYMVTDQPLDSSHIGVKIQGTIAGLNVNLLDIKLDALASNPLLGPLLSGIQGALDTLVVNVGYSPTGTLDLDDDQVVPCFVIGTLIATQSGLIPVEELTVGDFVATRDNGFKPIVWIGSAKVGANTLKRNPKLLPIRIKQGALGSGIPSSDLLVSPQHRILVRSAIAQRVFGTNEVLVAAKQLLQLDGVDIAEDMEDVEYFHFMFDQHEVVLSNGAETESLYAGPEALKALSPEAVNEILALFPELKQPDYVMPPARILASGRQARKLAVRHRQNRRPVVTDVIRFG